MGAAPFHFWAPDVYQGAPTAVTAWLSVTSKAAGVALFTRFVLAFQSPSGSLDVAGFDWRTTIAILSGVTMTIGNLGALWQTSLKRLLAYSSVAHVGYLLMGLAAVKSEPLGPGLGLALGAHDVLGGGGGPAVAFYLLAYLFMNLGAFAVVVAISNQTGSDELATFRGIGRRSPFLACALAIFIFALIGLPPTAGFAGKLQLFMAAIYAEYFGLVVLAGVNTAISVYYYMKVLKVVYLEGVDDPDAREPLLGSTGLTITCFVLLIPVLWLGLWFQGVAEKTQALEVWLRAG
jgi:NADH-quinone oxidoreductase subunit N